MHSLKLKDWAVVVSQDNDKIAISHMFSIKLKFAADFLLSCFKRKFRNSNLELSNEQKIQ